MKSMLLLGHAVLAVAWTLLAWGSHALLDWSGDAAVGTASLAGIPNDWMNGLGWLTGFLEQFGGALIAFVWFLGIAALAVSAWLVPALAARLVAALRGTR